MRRTALVLLLALTLSGCSLPSANQSAARRKANEAKHWNGPFSKIFQAAVKDSHIPSNALAINWTTDLPLDVPTRWKNEAPTLAQTYISIQSEQTDLPKEFPLTRIRSEEVPFIRTQTQEDFHRLLEAHPGLPGVVEFTQVGLGPDKRNAIVGLRYYHEFGRAGFRQDLTWLWLTEKEGEWVVLHRVDTGRDIAWAHLAASPSPSQSPPTEFKKSPAKP